jgi:hypothetical protein
VLLTRTVLFVEAAPPLVLRDGEGTTIFKLSHKPGCGNALNSRG